jgi:hypothetical protein
MSGGANGWHVVSREATISWLTGVAASVLFVLMVPG